MIICGTYGRTIFRDEKTGYTVFSFVSTDCAEYNNSKGYLNCCGISPIYASGMPLKLEGEIMKNSFGYQFSFTDVSEFSNKKATTVRYLSGDAFSGIGEKTAKKIVSIVGADIFSFVTEPDAEEMLTNIMGESKAVEFIRTVRNTMQQKLVLDYIKPFGGDYNNADKLVKAHPTKTIEKLKENCYEIGSRAGLSFCVCDSIAKSENYFVYDEKRVKALVITALKNYLNMGHTYCSVSQLQKSLERIVKSSAYSENIPSALILRTAIKSKDITVESSPHMRLYLTSMYKAEEALAFNIRRLQKNATPLPFANELVDYTELVRSIQYSDKQKSAFEFLKSSGIKILTGGPGTGKTLTINGLITAYERMCPGKRILLCAPTGRAAQKLSEVTSRDAYTIHKALDVKPFGDDIKYKNLEDPLDYDFIIVDEFSMTDTILASMLFGAIKNNSLVLICGDVNQLPSVGPGKVLGDMIESSKIETVTLDVIYRQAKGSDIVSNAATINEGSTNLKIGPTFKIIAANNAAEIQKTILEIMKKKYNQNNPYDVQVLSSTKKGAAGTFELNRSLQPICNKAYSSVSIGFRRDKYKIGDKIMMIANNYKDDYMNGDIGIIRDVTDTEIVAMVDNTEIKIKRRNIQDICLAYAATIHKSQGSEFPTVIIALPSEPSIMLQRNLLYTAVTRAREEVIIVAEGNSIEKAIRTLISNNRNCGLLHRLNPTIH